MEERIRRGGNMRLAVELLLLRWGDGRIGRSQSGSGWMR